MAAGLPTGERDIKTQSRDKIIKIGGEYVFLIPPVPADNFEYEPSSVVVEELDGREGDIIAIRNFEVCSIKCRTCNLEFMLTSFLSITGSKRSFAEECQTIFTENDVLMANVSKDSMNLPLIKFYADPLRNQHTLSCVKDCCHCCFSIYRLREFYFVRE